MQKEDKIEGSVQSFVKKPNKNLAVIIIIILILLIVASILAYLIYIYLNKPPAPEMNETGGETPVIPNQTTTLPNQTSPTNITTNQTQKTSQQGGGGNGEESNPPCTPNCTGKQCGDNGCGGSCGACNESQYCNATGQCVLTPPNCTNDYGCSSAGSFCDINNMPYNCSLGGDGCLDRVNGTACGSGYYCDSGNCIEITDNIIFVDKNNLFGNGCNNDWPGTIEQPKCDVNSPWFQSNLDPGDRVILRQAVYSPMRFYESSSGTEENPVVVKAYSDEKILLDNANSNFAQIWFFENVSDITIEGPVEITYSVYPIITKGNNSGIRLHSIKVDNIDCENGVRPERDCRGVSLNGCTDCEIKNLVISHLQGCCGVKAFYANNITFENLEIYNVDDGKGANGDADGVVANYADNLIFVNVSTHNISEDGFDLGSNAVLINCKSYNNIGAGLKAWRRSDDGYTKKRVKIINSLFYDNGYFPAEPDNGNPGIKASAGAELEIYNSVILRNSDEGIGIRSYSTASDTAYSIISNTIIADNGYEGVGVDNTGTGFNNVTASNNLYFNNILGSTNGLNLDINPIIGQDPLFIDAINNKFSLQQESPAIDNGIIIPGYHCTTSGSHPGENCREWYGNAPDIGAYEYIPAQTQECTIDSDCTYRGPGFICNESSVCSWKPPIGIPKPEFGIEESYRMYDNVSNRNPALNYTQNSEGGFYTHYVDSTHPNCTDVDNDYGSESKPRNTIPTTLFEGSVVEIHNRVLGTSTTYITSNGSSKRPIFIRGYNHNDMPLVEGTLDIRGKYSIWENLKIHNPGRFWIVRKHGSNASFISLRNNEVYGDGNTNENHAITITTNAESGEVFSHIIIYNNHLHHRGNSEIIEQNDIMGIAVGSKCEDIWILDNEIDHMGGDSFQGNSEGYTLNRVYIGRNIMHDDRENAIDIKRVDGIVVSENEIYGYDTDQGQAIITHYSPTNIWLLGNKIYDSRYGISSAARKLYIIGNVIHDISGVGITYNSGENTYLINNVLSNCSSGIGASGTYPTTIVNNVIFNIINTTSGDHLILRGILEDNSTAMNNLFYQAGGEVKINWGGASYNLSSFQATGKCQGCIESDPKFVDSANGNFRLQPDSPAIDTGNSEIIENLSDLYYSTFGVDIRKDIEGRTRPQDGDGNGSAEWDIGAYEYNGGIGGMSAFSPSQALPSKSSFSFVSQIYNWIKRFLTGNTIKEITGYFLRIKI